MRDDKIVVRRIDKSLLKGRIYDFCPDKPFCTMRLLNGDRIQLRLKDVKAIFIVKSYAGNKNYKYSYKNVLLYGGLKIKIIFNDNEEMIGYMPFQIYSAKGFFVTPADFNGNNEKVFVNRSATREIVYL